MIQRIRSSCLCPLVSVRELNKWLASVGAKPHVRPLTWCDLRTALRSRVAHQQTMIVNRKSVFFCAECLVTVETEFSDAVAVPLTLWVEPESGLGYFTPSQSRTTLSSRPCLYTIYSSIGSLWRTQCRLSSWFLRLTSTNDGVAWRRSGECMTLRYRSLSEATDGDATGWYLMVWATF